jgi:hypothetical protein
VYLAAELETIVAGIVTHEDNYRDLGRDIREIYERCESKRDICEGNGWLSGAWIIRINNPIITIPKWLKAYSSRATNIICFYEDTLQCNGC